MWGRRHPLETSGECRNDLCNGRNSESFEGDWVVFEEALAGRIWARWCFAMLVLQ